MCKNVLSWNIVVAVGILFIPLWPGLYAEGAVEDLSDDMLAVGLEFAGQELNQEMISGSDKVVFKPNVHELLNASLSYGFVAFGFGIKGGRQGDSATFGKTDYVDYQLKMFSGPFLLEAVYQNYTGFYIDNHQAVVPGSATPILAPDLSVQKYYLSATYAFNNESFTLNHPYSISKLQTASAGSWLLQPQISRTLVDNKGNRIIPTAAPVNYGDLESLTGMKSTAVALGVGYSYTAIFGSFYINGTLIALPSLQFRNHSRVGGGEKHTDFDITGGVIRAGLGWNSRGWKVGFSTQMENSSSIMKDDSKVNVLTMNTALGVHVRKFF